MEFNQILHEFEFYYISLSAVFRNSNAILYKALGSDTFIDYSLLTSQQ